MRRPHTRQASARCYLHRPRRFYRRASQWYLKARQAAVAAVVVAAVVAVAAVVEASQVQRAVLV